jgi:hypothetical protein
MATPEEIAAWESWRANRPSSGSANLVSNRIEENLQLPAAADPRYLQEMFNQISQSSFRSESERLATIQRAQKLASEAKAARNLPASVARMAAQSGDMEGARLAASAYQRPYEEAKEEDKLGILGVIDTPARAGRWAVSNLVAPEGTDTSWDSPTVRNRNREYDKLIEDRVPILDYAAKTAGYPIGGAIGGLVGAGIEGYRAVTGQDADASKILDAAKSGAQIGTDIVRQIPTDPLSFVGAPIRGVKGTTQIVSRVAERAGLNPQVTAALVARTKTAMQLPLAKDRAAAVAKAFDNAGASQAFAKAFGPSGEMLEAGALRLGLAREGFGVDVGKLTGSEFGVRRAIANQLEKRGTMSPWNPDRVSAREVRRLARAVEPAVQARHAARAESMMKLAPPDVKRQSDLVEHYVDPEFQLLAPSAKDGQKLAEAMKGNKKLRGWFSQSSTTTGRDSNHVFTTRAIEAEIKMLTNRGQKILAKQPNASWSPARRVRWNNKRVAAIQKNLADLQAAKDKRINVLAKAAQVPKEIGVPSADEQKWLDEFQGFFTGVGDDLRGRGMKVGKSGNLATGRYAPRQFEIDGPKQLSGAFDFQKARRRPLLQGVPAGLFLRQQRQRYGGVEGMKLSVNPSELVTRQIGKASRKAAQFELKKSIAKSFGISRDKMMADRGLKNVDPVTGKVSYDPIQKQSIASEFTKYGVAGDKAKFVPNKIHELVEHTFKTGSLLQFMHQIKAPPSAVKFAEIFETSRAMFKRNRLARPGFAAINFVGDLGNAVLHGLDNPTKVLKASRWWQGNKGAAGYSGADLRQLMLDHNVISPTSITQVGGTPGVDFAQEAGRLQAQLERAAKVPLKQSQVRGQRVLEVGRKLDVPSKVVQRMNENASNSIRAALFVDGLEKGLAPAASADRVAKALLDYSDAPRVVQFARIFFPFANWLLRSPPAFARGALQNPGRAAALPKAVEAFEGESEFAAPERALERGAAFHAGPTVRRLLESAMMQEIPQNQNPVVLTRDPVSEATAPIYRAVTAGDFKALLQSFGPEIRAVIESSTGEDLFTGKPLRDVLEQQGNLGGLGPDAARTLGTILRYAAPYTVPAWADAPINNALANAEGDPEQRIGFMRPVTTDAQQAQKLRMLSMLTGSSVYMANPTTRMANLLYSEELRNRQSAAAGTRTLEKTVRSIARNRRDE